MEKIWTVLELLTWGTEYFAGKGIDSPRLTMELLLAHVLTVSRVNLYMQFDKPLHQNELADLRVLIQRRSGREPLQYIVGETNFFGLTLALNSSVLIPRPETEELVEIALRHLKRLQNENQRQINILDIGTGSGCIALSLASQLPQAHIVAIDVSEPALQLAAENARRLGIKNVFFQHCDILHEKPAGVFDLIISNPPYISQEDMGEVQSEIINFEPHLALTDGGDGLTFYRRFVSLAPELMADKKNSNSRMMIEIGYGQAGKVCQLFENNGFSAEVLPDFSGIERVVVVAVKVSRGV